MLNLVLGFAILLLFIWFGDVINYLTNNALLIPSTVIGIILLFALIVIGIYYHCKKGFSGYQCPFTVIQAMLIYVLVMRNKQRLEKLANSKCFKNFNRCSLGIYILHMLWINIIIKVLHVNIMDASIGIIFVMLLIIAGLSWMSTAILLKIPILNRYL